jgi:hypothetical protein
LPARLHPHHHDGGGGWAVAGGAAGIGLGKDLA